MEKVILYLVPVMLLLTNGLIFYKGLDDDNQRLALAVNILVVCLVVIAEILYIRRKR